MSEAPRSAFPRYTTAPVGDLVPYIRNARTHTEAQVAQIAASIREFGFTNRSWWMAIVASLPVTAG